MDLRTGFDFSRPSCQKRAWAVLESESPFLVVLSPPCTVWSSLRNLSNHKCDPEVLRKEEEDALTHLELPAKIVRWQHERGGLFILEQPATARSWKQPCLELLYNMDGIILVQTDLCEFVLEVGDVGLNRKPTGLLMNSFTMAQSLARKCTHESSEHETLVAHRGVSTSKAHEYMPQLCHAILKGLCKVLERSGTLRYPQGKSEDYYLELVFSHYSQEVQETANAMVKDSSGGFLEALWGKTYFEVDDQSGGTYPSVGLEPGGETHEHAHPDEGREGFEGAAPGNGFDPDFENDGEYPELDPDPVGGDVEEPSAVHKRLIQRAHVNLGHPGPADFLRILKHGRVKRGILNWVREPYRCPICAARTLPKAPGPGMALKSFRFNHAVGVDLFEVEDPFRAMKITMVSAICRGSNFQAVTRMKPPHTPEHVLEVF